MLRLPPLIVGNSIWRLPVCGVTGMGLMSAVLREDLTQRTANFKRLLSNDPALSLWVVCSARAFRNAAPTGIDALAEHFAENAAVMLQWPASDDGLRMMPTRDERLRWSKLATSGVAANHAAHLVDGESDAASVAVTALLHRAQDWLSSSGPQVAVTSYGDNKGCLPPWLSNTLRELQESSARSFHAMHVARVIEATKSGMGTIEASPVDSNGVAIDRYWMDEQFDVPILLLPDLARRLRRLQELEGEFQQQLEKEKLAALKELAYGASHEINNPLANISTRAQTLLRDETDPERRQKLAVINTQAFRAHEMISDMMLFARPPKLEFEQVDLTEMIDRIIAELRATAEHQETDLLRVTADDALLIDADDVHLLEAIKALCDNSLEAIGGGGKIELYVQAVAEPDDTGREFVEIQVADTGPGIAAEARKHLFDPYFSGREAGRGLGLGLSKCWRIIDDHGGEIHVENSPGQGAVFTIRLPRKPPHERPITDTSSSVDSTDPLG